MIRTTLPLSIEALDSPRHARKLSESVDTWAIALNILGSPRQKPGDALHYRARRDANHLHQSNDHRPFQWMFWYTDCTVLGAGSQSKIASSLRNIRVRIIRTCVRPFF